MGKLKFCDECQSVRGREHEYCIVCGEGLIILSDTCPECGHKVTEADEADGAIVHYCPKCGETMEEDEGEDEDERRV